VAAKNTPPVGCCVGDLPVRSLHSSVGTRGQQITVPGDVDEVVVNLDGKGDDPGLFRNVIGGSGKTEHLGGLAVQRDFTGRGRLRFTTARSLINQTGHLE
jgi:hypothetical protein